MKALGYILIVAAAVLAAACGSSQKKGPEDVVVEFSRAVAAGDFETAYGLCDTLSMKDYLDNCREAMELCQKKDSAVYSIAAGMLSAAGIDVMEVKKTDDGRSVMFSISAEGAVRNKLATVKKEEGEWRVTSISDAE